MTDHYEMPHPRADECTHAGVGKACRPCRDLLALLDAPAPAPSVVPEAAVEAAASAVRKERAFSAAAAFGVPMDGVPQCAEMIARTALTAALPFLTAAPSEVERIARALTETTALTGADALRIVQAAQAMSAPSATRDEVARTWHEAAPECGPGAWDRASERVRERSLPRADALLARFNITPKEDR